jgi:hypothetical protein
MDSELSVQQGLSALHHSCYCRSSDCGIKNCTKMKALIIHVLEKCRGRDKAICPVCKVRCIYQRGLQSI